MARSGQLRGPQAADRRQAQALRGTLRRCHRPRLRNQTSPRGAPPASLTEMREQLYGWMIEHRDLGLMTSRSCTSALAARLVGGGSAARQLRNAFSRPPTCRAVATARTAQCWSASEMTIRRSASGAITGPGHRPVRRPAHRSGADRCLGRLRGQRAHRRCRRAVSPRPLRGGATRAHRCARTPAGGGPRPRRQRARLAASRCRTIVAPRPGAAAASNCQTRRPACSTCSTGSPWNEPWPPSRDRPPTTAGRTDGGGLPGFRGCGHDGLRRRHSLGRSACRRRGGGHRVARLDR